MCIGIRDKDTMRHAVINYCEGIGNIYRITESHQYYSNLCALGQDTQVM